MVLICYQQFWGEGLILTKEKDIHQLRVLVTEQLGSVSYSG